MKLPGKKAIVISAASLAVITGGGMTALSLMRSTPAVAPQETVLNKADAPVEQVKAIDVADTTPTQEAGEPVAAPSVPTTPQVAPVPAVLSVNEYAQKYLNMSGIANQRNAPQECLDALVSLWPDRFNEDVREHNIKALKFYERGGTNTICSTGIIELLNGFTPPYTVPISAYGRNGEFFDSATANDYANR